MVIVTFVVAAVAFITGYPVPWYYFAATGLLDGLAWMPIVQLVVVPILGPTVRTVMGRLAFLQGQVAGDGTVQVMTTDGYEFCPYDEDKGAYYLNGEWIDYDAEDAQWYRVGNRKFGLTYEDDPAVLGEFRDDVPDGEGIVELGRERNGTTLFGRAGLGKAVASIGRIAQAFQDVADPKMSEEAEDKVLETDGGQGPMDMKYMVIGAMGSILMASIVGVLIFGVFG